EILDKRAVPPYYQWSVPQTNIPGPSIFVAGNYLDNDYNEYIALENGATIDITPHVPCSDFNNAWVNVTKHQLKIFANGDDCQPESVSNAPTFITGDFVMFSYDFETGIANCVVTSNKWHPGGTFFNDEINAVPSGVNCSTVPFVN